MTSPNYNETTVSGATWIRSFQVQINNSYNGTPTVVFLEERAVALSDNTVLTIPVQPGFCEVGFDPSAQIPLVNPWTGEPMTNNDPENPVQQYASHIEAYILLWSLYLQTAMERDAAANAPADPPPDLLYDNPPPEEPPP